MLNTELNTVSHHKTVGFITLDFDGCIFNKNYDTSNSPTKIIDSNQLLFGYIKQIVADHKLTCLVVMVFSNRQSRSVDLDNIKSKNNESCYPALLMIGKYLKTIFPSMEITVDTFLLPDAYNSLKPGTTFIKALAEDATDHPEWVFDTGKMSIAYTQMQRAVNLFPTSNIIFCAFDDTKNILTRLKTFFTVNLLLIPKQLQFLLHDYNGNSLEIVTTLQNTYGFVDKNYYYSLKMMAKLSDIRLQDMLAETAAYDQTLVVSNLTHLIHTVLYLKTEFSKDEIEKLKQAANAQLYDHIIALNTFDDIYDLFLKIKDPNKNIIRAHRLNYLSSFGDTDSYRAAMKQIYGRITKDLIPDNLAKFSHMNEIITEVKRCCKKEEEYKNLDILGKCKEMALDYIDNALLKANTLAKLSSLLDEISTPHNILRLHRENILHKEGDTTSYRTALYKIADAILSFKSITSNDLELLYKLQHKLGICKKSNLQLYSHIINVNAMIHQLSVTTISHPDTTLQT